MTLLRRTLGGEASGDWKGEWRTEEGGWSMIRPFKPLYVFWVLFKLFASGGNCFHIQRGSSSLHAFLFPIVLVTDFRFRVWKVVCSESQRPTITQWCVFLTERQTFLMILVLTKVMFQLQGFKVVKLHIFVWWNPVLGAICGLNFSAIAVQWIYIL